MPITVSSNCMHSLLKPFSYLRTIEEAGQSVTTLHICEASVSLDHVYCMMLNRRLKRDLRDTVALFAGQSCYAYWRFRPKLRRRLLAAERRAWLFPGTKTRKACTPSRRCCGRCRTAAMPVVAGSSLTGNQNRSFYYFVYPLTRAHEHALRVQFHIFKHRDNLKGRN